jgi:hypothetical protein
VGFNEHRVGTVHPQEEQLILVDPIGRNGRKGPGPGESRPGKPRVRGKVIRLRGLKSVAPQTKIRAVASTFWQIPDDRETKIVPWIEIGG